RAAGLAPDAGPEEGQVFHAVFLPRSIAFDCRILRPHCTSTHPGNHSLFGRPSFLWDQACAAAPSALISSAGRTTLGLEGAQAANTHITRPIREPGIAREVESASHQERDSCRRAAERRPGIGW